MEKDTNKIAPLENEFHKEQRLRQKNYEAKMHQHTRRIFLLSVVGLLGLALAFIRILHDGSELHQLQKEEVVVTKKAQQLQKQEAALNEDVTLLQDEDYVAKLARSRYLLTLEGEQVYDFPKDASDTKVQDNPTFSVEKEK